MEFENEILKLHHPFTCIVSGPSKSGKTFLVYKLLRYLADMIDRQIDRIYYVYNQYQSKYDEISKMAKIEMVQGIPDPELILNSKYQRKMVIFDDLMLEFGKKAKQGDILNEMFTKLSHHSDISFIHIVQNLFYSNLRTARINSEYLILLKSPGDQLQIHTLASQIYPQRKKYLIEAYLNATAKPHGYLLIDLHQTTPDIIRIRTNIFPNDISIIYVPK